MSKNAGIVLEFNGHKYDLQKMLTVAAASPNVRIDELDGGINTEKHPQHEEHLVTFHNGTPEPAKEMVIFKQHGGHTILLGAELIGSGKARLISTPALKKARFEKEEPATPERVQSSSATGAMADKMQQAYAAPPRPTSLRQAGDMDTRRFDAPVRQPQTQRPASFQSTRPDHRSTPQYSANRPAGFKKP